MTHPIFNTDGEAIGCIQALSKVKKNAKSKQKLYTGFSNFDEVLFIIYGLLVQAKFQ